ncbi:MAG: DsrE/DsrF/DrsH-like family protein [Deltaproteobacteria bacterium]|nr:DsrE/DsrF/DrsH-like family protein [Deltaproteobacteria bacterium]
MDEAQIKKLIDDRVDEILKERLAQVGQKNRLAIIASKGTLDMAYPPLILASTGAAFDLEVGIFFTFYGLDILNKKKNKNLKVPSLANPAMPIPVPNIIGVLPGMTAMATSMMNNWMAKQNVPTIPELLKACIEGGVKLIACQMTMDVMGVKKEDLVDEIELGGAASFLDFALDAKTTLFV